MFLKNFLKIEELKITFSSFWKKKKKILAIAVQKLFKFSYINNTMEFSASPFYNQKKAFDNLLFISKTFKEFKIIIY